MKAGSIIGIIGGGQLARMLAMAAFPLGYKIAIYEPLKDCPASLVTDKHFCAEYNDEAALIEFAKYCDVVTFEFENVPASATQIIADHTKLYPNPKALELTQDRIIEKTFIQNSGLKTAPFFEINNLSDLQTALKETGTPAILKTRRLGYDGKGQYLIKSLDEAAIAWESINQEPAILEGFIEFSFETSIIITRGLNGEIASFPNSQNIHKGGILRECQIPAPLNDDQIKDAQNIGAVLANALDYIGTMAVELFVTKHGMVVNEIAPRVHNSGHWTIEGTKTSQFANHIRAICGLPLGNTDLTVPEIKMYNLIGDEILNSQELLKTPNLYLHDYGKTEVKSGRKMGHYTIL